MTQILSASCNNNMQQARAATKINNYLQILAHPKYHRQGTTPDARLRLAKKILGALLGGVAIEDTNPSYTNAPTVNPDAKNVTPQKSLPDKLSQCRQRVREYMGTDAPQESIDRICSIVVPGISATGPMIGSQRIAHGTGGGYTTNITTRMPDTSKLMKKSDAVPKPHVYSASTTEKPAWMKTLHVFDDVPDNLPQSNVPSNLKSAAENYNRNKALYDNDIASILESHANARQAASEAKHNRLMSASEKKKSEIPAWAKIACPELM